jgi:xylono-1,5-lactonase
MQAECILDIGTLLGEGPLWNCDDQQLWSVDIKGRKLNSFDPTRAKHTAISVAGEPGFIVRAAGGKMIVGMDRGLHVFHGTDELQLLTQIAMPAHNRLNDAVVDPQGRLWCGSMDNGEAASTGAFHCFDGRTVRTVTEAGTCPITNGPAVSADGSLLYTVDTLGRQIWRYRMTEEGDLVDRTCFLTLENRDGAPDGVVCDSAGCLWLALWNGWGVRRYDRAGKLMATVPLPCAQVTKVAFGGDDLRTAYVTTAAIGLDAAARAAQPLAGGLFAFDVDVAGLPAAAVNLAGTGT